MNLAFTHSGQNKRKGCGMKKAIILVGFLLVSRCAFAVLTDLAAASIFVVIGGAAGCCIEANPPLGSVRAHKNHGWAAREGLAFSRILTSPLNLVLAPCGMSHANISTEERTGFDKFAAEPVVFVASVCYGAVGTVDEILVGTFEALTTMKARPVYYPWETSRVSSNVMKRWLAPSKDSESAQKNTSKSLLQDEASCLRKSNQ